MLMVHNCLYEKVGYEYQLYYCTMYRSCWCFVKFNVDIYLILPDIEVDISLYILLTDY